MRENVDGAINADILSVLITPIKKVRKSAKVHLKDGVIWPLQVFRDWAEDAISTIRELRARFVEAGDLEWRANAADLI